MTPANLVDALVTEKGVIIEPTEEKICSLLAKIDLTKSSDLGGNLWYHKVVSRINLIYVNQYLMVSLWMSTRDLEQVNIEDEMIPMVTLSVIVGRALPDARDGLKPVHRRVLYSMHEAGVSGIDLMLSVSCSR